MEKKQKNNDVSFQTIRNFRIVKEGHWKSVRDSVVAKNAICIKSIMVFSVTQLLK